MIRIEKIQEEKRFGFRMIIDPPPSQNNLSEYTQDIILLEGDLSSLSAEVLEWANNIVKEVVTEPTGKNQCIVTEKQECPWEKITGELCARCEIPPIICPTCKGTLGKHFLDCVTWTNLKKRMGE